MKLDVVIPDEQLDELADRIAARIAPTAAASPEAPGLYNVVRAGEWFNRSDRWVRERVARGELRHVRLDGGALAFRLEDLQAFADARLVPAIDAEGLLRAV